MTHCGWAATGHAGWASASAAPKSRATTARWGWAKATRLELANIDPTRESHGYPLRGATATHLGRTTAAQWSLTTMTQKGPGYSGLLEGMYGGEQVE